MLHIEVFLSDLGSTQALYQHYQLKKYKTRKQQRLELDGTKPQHIKINAYSPSVEVELGNMINLREVIQRRSI